jgi:hypothetical protein
MVHRLAEAMTREALLGAVLVLGLVGYVIAFAIERILP